jgi:predicted metalloprotease
MRWQGRRGSSNVEDRRRMSGRAAGGIGGLGLLVIILIGLFFGIDLTPLATQGGGPIVVGGGQSEPTEADEQAAEFVSVVLADTEEVWAGVFASQVGEAYVPPALILFSGATQSACGGATAATGPFYCPNDRQVYLDTDFFSTMTRQLGAEGDFAAAYVVAHEVGHHVQNLLGILSQANTIRMQVSEAESNAISVRIELQADCYAGVWAHHADELCRLLVGLGQLPLATAADHDRATALRGERRQVDSEEQPDQDDDEQTDAPDPARGAAAHATAVLNIAAASASLPAHRTTLLDDRNVCPS